MADWGFCHVRVIRYNWVMNEPQIKPDWKDFVALVIAAYQVLLVPLLVIIGVGVLVVMGLSLLAR